MPKPQGPKGAARETKATERKLQAVQLRKEGKNLREIAKIIGCSHETVRTDIKQGLKELREDTMHAAEEYRSIQVARREAVIAAHWKNALDPTIDGWRQSAQTVHENEVAISKLMGTDQPVQMETKTEVTGGNAGPLTINLVATELGTGEDE